MKTLSIVTIIASVFAFSATAAPATDASLEFSTEVEAVCGVKVDKAHGDLRFYGETGAPAELELVTNVKDGVMVVETKIDYVSDNLSHLSNDKFLTAFITRSSESTTQGDGSVELSGGDYQVTLDIDEERNKVYAGKAQAVVVIEVSCK